MNLGAGRNFAGPLAAKLPEARVRLVQCVVRVARIAGQPVRIYQQPAGHGLAQHPVQGDVRQAAFVVPAAHVRVDAGEPDLLNRLVLLHPALVPHKGRKVAALLVYGQGVEAMADLGVEPRVVKTLARVQRQGLDRVPHADEVDRTGAAEGRAEARRNVGLVRGVVDL